MAGQIERKHIAAVIAEVAALQAEGRVVEAGPVHEHEGRLLRIERVRGRVGKSPSALDGELHQAFAAALRARSRSSIKSRLASSPIERRTVPAVMPDFARSASLMR